MEINKNINNKNNEIIKILITKNFLFKKEIIDSANYS